MLDSNLIKQAANLIKNADGLLITAGAGMGVDSGLPDFRGNEGFWNAYPKFRHLGLSFVDLANPRWFYDKPSQAWGFYGHRYELYRQTAPHQGYVMLKKWCDRKAQGGFVFTSNVDGHFQKAGFDSEQIIECHGSINHLQCVEQCSNAIWPGGDLKLSVDEGELLALGELPSCPRCGEVARPNILMFGDFGWNSRRTDQQTQRYQQWLHGMRNKKLVILEFGAGLAVPTVRYEGEAQEGVLIRVNPRDCSVPAGALSISSSAFQAIEQLDSVIN